MAQFMNRNSTNSSPLLTSNHWGTGIVRRAEGRVVAVDPHPEDIAPSRINENIPGGLYGTARVLRPAVRKGYLEAGPLGRQGERGRDTYVEVDWDCALSLVAGEVQRVRETNGNTSIFGGSYGWASAGRFHHAQGQLKRFLNAAGGFVRSEGNYSFNAALVLMPHIVGNFRHHVKDATRWRVIAEHGRLAVMFGGVPVRNAQVSGGGVACHRLGADLSECAKAGIEFVNFSPLRGDAAADLNAEWLTPRPGSDTAIMMGLSHTLIAEDLHDKAFLDRYTVGFETVRQYLMGEADGVVKDAEWASAQSGIDAQRLRDLARHMAAGPTLICTAVGLQRAEYGEQPLWMTVVLAALLGQIGQPGGGYGIGYGADASIGTTDRPFRWPSFPQGSNPVSDFIPVAMISELLLNPGGSYDYNGERMIFPDIRMVWWAGGNPFHHHQDLNRLRDAFQKPETIVVNEINWTATARHADIVLPVAATLERDDFGAGTQDFTVVPMPKAVEPVGDARCEFDIYKDLEERLSLGTAFSDGLSADEWQERMWQELQYRSAGTGKNIPTWENFLQGDAITFQDPHPDAVFLSEFRKDPNAHPLNTPSGKLELASETIAGFQYDDCPGHPTWLPPREWLGSANKDYPLHLISGQPTTRLHSQYDAGAYSRSRKIHGREPIMINRSDAEARGIQDGDIVLVQNARGSCLAGAAVSDDIREGVVFLWTGAWYDPDLDHPDKLDRHGNPNVLTHDYRTSRLSQGPAAQSALVQVSKFSEPVPAVKAFLPPLAG